MRGLLCVALVLSLAACEPPSRTVTLTIRAPQAERCRPGEVLRVDLQPLADSPLSERPRQSLDLRAATASQTLAPFAPQTRAVAVDAQARESWEGGGIALLDAGVDDLVVPVLPFGTWCALSDPDLRLREGAALTALPDGRFVIAGGDTGEIATDEVLIVTPGAPIADRASIRLSRERTHATATWAEGSWVVVAGGSIEADRGVRDTLDLLDLDAQTVEIFDLLAPRYDHAAVRLSDGAVLLVGGRLGETEPVTALERVEIGEDEVTTERVAASRPRVHPRALALDDGAVVIVGGEGEDGRPARAIERWDGASLTELGEWDARPGAAYVALAGGRAAMVGGRDDMGEWLGRVVLLLESGEQLALEEAITPVASPRALGLADGRLLVVGEDPATGARLTQRIDPGGTRTTPRDGIDATRPNDVPTALLPLADGSIVGADVEGVDLLRVDLASSFDEPPAAIDPGQILGQESLSLDAPGRWTAEPPSGVERGPLFASVDGARLDLPQMRFGSLDLEVELVGEGEVLLTRDGAAPVVVSAGADRVALDGCAVRRAGGAAIRVTRDGGSLQLYAGDDTASCEVPEEDRLGVAVRLPADSGVQRISAAR